MTLVNKVEATGIITVDLNKFRPAIKSVFFDLKDHLYQGMMLREKEFKASLANVAWAGYANTPVAIGCSTDAIIPTWAYMVLAERLAGIASHIAFSTAEALDVQLWKEYIDNYNFDYLTDEKVAVRAHLQPAPEVYLAITAKLKPIVKSLMYGEAGMPKVIYKR